MASELDNPSSPHSSSGVEDSLRGTPDTRITSVSLEGTRTKSGRAIKTTSQSVASSISAATPPQQQYNSGFEPERDPFLTPRYAQRTTLSPTASSFNPLMKTSPFRQVDTASPVADSLSNDLGLSRFLLISSSAEPLTVEKLQQWLNDLEIRSRHFYGQKTINACGGKAHVQFDDIRDSCSVLTAIMISMQDWRVEYCGPFPCAQSDDSGLKYIASTAGQLQVVATTSNTFTDMCQILDITRTFLQSYGRLFAFAKETYLPQGSLKAIAEFCDISHYARMISTFTQVTTPEGVHLVITPYPLTRESANTPDQMPSNCEMALQNALCYQSRDLSLGPQSVQPRERFTGQPLTMYPLMVQSPFFANFPHVLNSVTSGRSQGPLSPIGAVPSSYSVLSPLYCTPPSPALTVQNNCSPSRTVPGFLRPDGRRQNAARIAKTASNGSANHHNYVDVSRIREGIDVRTTIMLRNIPNKVDQVMLKRIIDESSWGKYDFMYLRIDFANDCNVGYAFINFVDPLDIIDFVEARGNQRWNCFKSDKIAEISYATIQGKDCLVQKFRNSSVMLEAPHYRPKLYFTCNGPRPELAGQEESFPDPDNQSKMKRSCENAEHVGLFTPNAGQHYRDEQRRRRSQYDRGTRLAALEEFDYEAAIQNLYSDTPN